MLKVFSQLKAIAEKAGLGVVMSKSIKDVFIGSVKMRALNRLSSWSGIGFSKLVVAIVIAGIKQAEQASEVGDVGLVNFMSDNQK